VRLGTRRPRLDAEGDGALHWPVLLLFPETGQQDVIEDWHEEDLVADHLDVVRGCVVCAAAPRVCCRAGCVRGTAAAGAQ
jgi:hypothetical protein